MFICKECLDEHYEKKNLSFVQVSYGGCEMCHQTKPCYDIHHCLLSKKKKGSERDTENLVKATYLFPNGMVATFGYDDQQMPELQGQYTKELYEKIKQQSDEKTEWHGFEQIT